MRKLLAIAIFTLTGCQKSSPRGAEPKSAIPTSTVKTFAAGVGSANEATRQRLVEDTIAYTYELIPLLASWDGSCAAQIRRMKKLAPLVQRIRDDTLAVGPEVASHIKDALQERKAEVMAKLDQQLAELHLTQV